MIKVLAIMVFGSLLLLMGCESSSGGESEQPMSKYSGVWFSSEFNAYIKISSQGVFSSYLCTLYDGYEKDSLTHGEVKGEELTIQSNQVEELYQLEINQEILSLSIDEVKVDLARVDSIPTSCDDDAIEIVDLTPIEVYEGEGVEFSVSFDLRLSSVEGAIVEVGFTSDEDGSYTISDQGSVIIKSSGIESGSLTVLGNPRIFDSGRKFNVYIHLSPEDQEGVYSPYASSQREIRVIPRASSANKTFNLVRKNTLTGTSPFLVFVPALRAEYHKSYK